MKANDADCTKSETVGLVLAVILSMVISFSTSEQSQVEDLSEDLAAIAEQGLEAPTLVAAAK